MAVTSAVLMPLNSSGGIGVIKILQIFDYQGFIDVKKPSNAEAVFSMFNSNFLDLVPNPLEIDEYDNFEAASEQKEAGLPGLRMLTENSLLAERRCLYNEVMSQNEFSCYLINSSGKHIIHISVYILLKTLLMFLVHCLCQ